MNVLKTAVIGMNNTRQLFFGIPEREIDKKISAVIHRDHFSFWIYKGLFVMTGDLKHPYLIIDISPNGDIAVEQYREIDQRLSKTSSEVIKIRHFDIQEPYNDFLDAERERQELIEKLKQK